MARTVAAAEFAIETAMRSGEICALTWGHVHPRHVHIPDSKTGAARDVPLSPRASEIIEQMRAVKDACGVVGDTVFDLVDSQRDALWRKVRDRALIEGLNFHDLRREAATRMAKMFDVLTLAKITGHRDLKLLRDVYYAPTPDELSEIMAKSSVRS
jgi:integrase